MAIETLADIRQISMAEESEEYAALPVCPLPRHPHGAARRAGAAGRVLPRL